MTNLLHPLITSMLYQFDSMAYNKKYTCYVKNNIKNEFCIPNLVILEVLHAKIYPFLEFQVFKMAADGHLDYLIKVGVRKNGMPYYIQTTYNHFNKSLTISIGKKKWPETKKKS